MTKSRIALLVALMFAAPAAVVALEQTESAMEVEAADAAVQEIQAAAAEPVTGTETATAGEAAEQGNAVAAAPVIAVEPAAAPAPVARQARAVSPFPQGSEFGDTLLPSQVAYFERLERERAHLAARGDVFPDSGESRMLPSQVAYFERLDQQRIAAAQPQPVVARVEPAVEQRVQQPAQLSATELSPATTVVR